MPIAGVLAAQRVNSAGNSQPITDERIRVNVGVIIVVDEVVADSLAKNEPGNCNEKNADNCDCGARIAPWKVRILAFSHRFDVNQARSSIGCPATDSSLDKDLSHRQIGSGFTNLGRPLLHRQIVKSAPSSPLRPMIPRELEAEGCSPLLEIASVLVILHTFSVNCVGCRRMQCLLA